MTKLPDKPSELLRMGLEDFAKIEADPRYVPNLDQWHWPVRGLCHACMAGAVMAHELGIGPDINILSLNEFDQDTANKLNALDCLRSGRNRMAGLWLKNERLQHFGYRIIPDYKSDPQAWRAALDQLADDLEAAGL